MSERATGTFDVTSNPEPPYDAADGVSLGRVTISKSFRGDLEGRSTVQMLSATTRVKGSAGYVALERVVGTLCGRAGSFVLQHSGTMNRGEAALSVTVVPDSGTGQLAGLTGKLVIDVDEGKHMYTFEYTLPGHG